MENRLTVNYILEQRVLGPRLRMDITEERFNILAHARKVLSDALAFEQRYELLLGNFIAMELVFTELGFRAKLEHQYEYLELAETLRQANRHFVNVLTAMRGYADQVPQDFRCLDIDPRFEFLAKQELRKTFDRSSNYRFMCALRNHVQHKATAIHGFEGADSLHGDPNGWAEGVKFHANKSILLADGDFKRQVLEEQPEKIDVRRRARRSVQELGVAHLSLRSCVSEHVDASRAAFEQAIQDYRAAGAESAVGLCARREGDADADVPILLNWDDVRLKLVSKNDRSPNVWPRRAFGEPTVEQVLELRKNAGHSASDAAKSVCVSEERWLDYEDGLPMPEGLFHLYRLQTGQHPTHDLRRSDVDVK